MFFYALCSTMLSTVLLKDMDLKPLLHTVNDTFVDSDIPFELFVEEQDDDLPEYAIFDGSGDYSTYESTFTVPYGHTSTLITLLSQQSTTESPSTEATEISPQCPRACRLADLTLDERRQLKGDPGPPGYCNVEEIKRQSKGAKGEPGETKYIVKLIGKDLPPIRSEVFKQALQQILMQNLKGEKGEPGLLDNKYSANSNFVTISRFKTLAKYYEELFDHGIRSPAELVIIDNNDKSDQLFLRFGDSINEISMNGQFKTMPSSPYDNEDFSSSYQRDIKSVKVKVEDRPTAYASTSNETTSTQFRALTLRKSYAFNQLSSNTIRLLNIVCALILIFC